MSLKLSWFTSPREHGWEYLGTHFNHACLVCYTAPPGVVFEWRESGSSAEASAEGGSRGELLPDGDWESFRHVMALADRTYRRLCARESVERIVKDLSLDLPVEGAKA